MPSDVLEILEGAVTSETLFTDDYDVFVDDRAEKLAKIAADLCGVEVGKDIFADFGSRLKEITASIFRARSAPSE